ncbi:hypothetical protein GC163_15310 [bacterium]|nr:hypothetical protein [bacterium]
MKAWSDVLKQLVLSAAVCGLLACGMAYVGSPAVVGSEQTGAWEQISTKETFGRCRQCGNPVRMAPKEWCTSCQTCGQLTNVDQLHDWNSQKDSTRERFSSGRWAE